MRFFFISVLTLVFKLIYPFENISHLSKVFDKAHDSIKVNSYLYYSNEFSLSDSVNYLTWNDSSLTFLHRYAFHKFGLEWHNGNIGLSRSKLFFQYPYHEFGFILGLQGFDNYFFSSEQNKFFFTKRPYTEISVLLGSNKEQIAKLLHTQNVNERWNIAFRMNRTSSEGFYSRQNSNFNSTQLQSNYTSKTKKYAAIVQTNFNRSNAFENGGIVDTVDVLNSNEFLNSKGIPVNLNDARRRTSENSVWIKQFFNLVQVDSIQINDSLFKHYSIVKARITNLSGISSRYTWFKDSEAILGYYPNYRDSITNDSINRFSFYDELRAHFYFKSIEINGGFKYEWNKIRMIYYDTLAQNFIGLASMKWHHKKGHRLVVNSHYVFDGFNKNDARISAFLGYKILENWELSAFYLLDNRTPTLQDIRWVSNNFEWLNSFKKTLYNGANVCLNNNLIDFKISFSWHNYTNPVFYDFVARPKQSDGSSQIIQALVEKSFHIGKFYLTNTITYQKTSSDSIFRLPEVISKNAFYFQSELFKQVMKIQFGIDFYYFSKFTPYAYMAATNVYYLQNNKSSGDYPFFDIFLNFKVKSLRGFIMLDHINQGFIGNNQFYFMPGYPFPGRTIKLGITWVFRD
jgi:hypothetical protein